jgi:hypothetical protein
MSVIRPTATADPDGVPHLQVPAGREGEYEVQVLLTPKPAAGAKPQTPEELGWPPGYFENVIGSVTDEKFVAPPRDSIKRIPPLEGE